MGWGRQYWQVVKADRKWEDIWAEPALGGFFDRSIDLMHMGLLRSSCAVL